MTSKRPYTIKLLNIFEELKRNLQNFQQTGKVRLYRALAWEVAEYFKWNMKTMLYAQKKSVLTLVILCTLIDPSFASVECYKCVFVSSGVSTICGEIFDTAANVNNTQTCNGSCYKSTTSVDGVITAIARGCTPTCSEVCAEVLDIEGCNYCCDDTKCNRATVTTLSGVAMGTAFLAALSYYL